MHFCVDLCRVPFHMLFPGFRIMAHDYIVRITVVEISNAIIAEFIHFQSSINYHLHCTFV